jgi:hypothetical protein
MRYNRLAILAGMLVAACNGGDAAPQANGPIMVGVTAGNNQTVAAEHLTALPAVVAVQAVQQPNGQVAWHAWVEDALLPKRAYAQSAVHGVPNLVACGKTPTDPKHTLLPEVPCTNTDATGMAYFTFLRDTTAGTSKAYIAATVNGVTVVTDSVKATITPGPCGVWIPAHATPSFSAQAGVRFSLRDSIFNVWDKYNNPITGPYLIRYRRINASAGLSDPDLIVGDSITVRATDLQLDIAVDSTRNQYPVHFTP